MLFKFHLGGQEKKIQNGQTEPEGVQVYSERFSLFVAKRFSLFVAKRYKFKKIENNEIFYQIK